MKMEKCIPPLPRRARVHRDLGFSHSCPPGRYIAPPAKS